MIHAAVLRLTGALVLLGCVSADALSQQAAESPWYLERGTAPRTNPSPDTVVQTAQLLAGLLRDGGVPGFYDGQFAALAGRGEDLAAIIRDPGLHHVLRVMAVMAMQEVESGASVTDVLDHLVLPADMEFGIELEAWQRNDGLDDEDWTARLRQADLSQHARFALAKDGQPGRVLEKIRVMDASVQGNMPLLLDPTVRSETSIGRGVAWGRRVIFDVGYHFQQFDDYAHAAEWFGRLCDNLPGHRETTMAHYNLACIAALQGRPGEAVVQLQRAYAVGFTDVAWMEEDGDLQSLRDLPAFRALAAAMRNEAPPPDGGAAQPPAWPPVPVPPLPGDGTP
jgi:hypothetical protein